MNSNKKSIKIAYLTECNAANKRCWSGTIYYMAKALQKHCGEVYPLGPVLVDEYYTVNLWKEASKAYPNKVYNCWNNVSASLQFGKIFSKKLSQYPFDIIFAPIAYKELAFINTDIPIIYLSDATFNLLLNYHPLYTNFMDISICEGNMIEQLAINKSDILLYATNWAANSGIQDYHAPKSKIHVVPFGANLDYVPSQEVVLNKRKSKKCRLLFIGTNWESKGGDIAFETLLYLEKLGVKSHLTICGCTPPYKLFHDNITIIPFLDKNNKQDFKRLYDLYLNSDFLILPTRNECFGIVFAEACAFGVPCITTNTGGVAEVVRNFENGFTLPLEASGLEYANTISKIYKDDDSYYNLIKSSRKTFEEKLNWDSWAKSVKNIINETINNIKINNK
ncbi:glycosyltransferase family 4 protein [Haloimpatiens sp. FM7330]|uniref:glycosyltransferase family 4 protein n=1 Tax=Haloimpatiens sp. FM7330 TaxID=3298610 RepID=UPI0036397DA6